MVTTDHFWQTLPNFFTATDHHTHLAKLATERDWKIITLVGVYAGACAAYLGVELERHNNKSTKIDLVDWFRDVPVAQVMSNLEPIRHRLGNVHVGVSWDMASTSVDAVYIDAGHDRESVEKDIEAWLPVVQRKDGCIGGHDYRQYRHPNGFEFGVIEAVAKFGLDKHPSFRVWQGRAYDGSDGSMATDPYWPSWFVDFGVK